MAEIRAVKIEHFYTENPDDRFWTWRIELGGAYIFSKREFESIFRRDESLRLFIKKHFPKINVPEAEETSYSPIRSMHNPRRLGA